MQIDMNRPGEWAVRNATKIKPSKIKAVNFMRARGKEPLNNFLGRPKNSGSEQLKLLRNNLTQRFNLGLSGYLHSSKSLEGT
jgi:hypothetical protein